jgi:hypothetical protein
MRYVSFRGMMLGVQKRVVDNLLVVILPTMP